MSDLNVLISEEGDDFVFSSRTGLKSNLHEKEKEKITTPQVKVLDDVDFLDSVDIEESSSGVTLDE